MCLCVFAYTCNQGATGDQGFKGEKGEQGEAGLPGRPGIPRRPGLVVSQVSMDTQIVIFVVKTVPNYKFFLTHFRDPKESQCSVHQASLEFKAHRVSQATAGQDRSALQGHQGLQDPLRHTQDMAQVWFIHHAYFIQIWSDMLKQ